MDATRRKPVIMVVDDSPLNIKILGSLLEKDYELIIATNGEQVFDVIKGTVPDLILLDIMMPGMSGYEVQQGLKADPMYRDIPVIFLTAMTNPQNEIDGLKMGAVDFITKPFNGDIVRLRIRNHLELKFLRDRQTQLALLDGLTGLPNRRSFDATLGREWLRASRGHKPLALAMIDIDHFKAYNDSRGHLQGDDCLKQVAATLAAALVRPADFVARFGGEEFCCILPETSLTDALGVTERLRSHIENLQLPHGSSTVGPVVTISAGVASQFPTPEDDPKTLIGEADRLLYLAKQSGRNRVAG